MTIHWRDLTTAGKIEAIKAVYEPGMSVSEIASAIGGISRNAIAGMYTRYRDDLQACGLRPFRTCGRSKKGVSKPQRKTLNLDDFATRRSASTKRKPPAAFIAVGLPISTAGRPLMALGSHQCRWPVNEAEAGELHLFCGAATDRSYCPEHHALAYRPSISAGR